MPEFGTYRYYSKEWATFWKLVKDEATPLDDLELAFKALGHLFVQTQSPEDLCDRLNFEKSIEIASGLLLERRVREGGL